MMDEVFKDIRAEFQEGAMLIIKLLFGYIIIPVIIGLILLGFVFKIRGKLLSLLTLGIGLIGLVLFIKFGLPSITDHYS